MFPPYKPLLGLTLRRRKARRALLVRAPMGGGHTLRLPGGRGYQMTLPSTLHRNETEKNCRMKLLVYGPDCKHLMGYPASLDMELPLTTSECGCVISVPIDVNKINSEHHRLLSSLSSTGFLLLC